MLILIEQVLKQYWYVSRCANNELAPCILKLKNNTEWKQTTVTEITENRFGNFRFWGENMLDRFGFFSFSSPVLLYMKCSAGLVVSAPDFGSQNPEFKSHWKRNSALDCLALHCIEPFIIILPWSGYDLNNVERDIKHQIIIM